MEILKRNGKLVEFDSRKIYRAIMKAMKKGSGLVDKEVADKITKDIEKVAKERKDHLKICEIENLVYMGLIEQGHELTAKYYEGYRAIQQYKRENNTTDHSIMSLIELKNEDVMNENSNKNAVMVSTQRDLIAGEVSKDITRRKKLPAHIVQAHDEGVLHFHDMDYFMQHMFNCLGRETEFITQEGVKSFKDYSDGDEVEVITHKGRWKKATVRNYGRQKLYTIVFGKGKIERKVRATKNHRWILSDGSITTDLRVGDVIYKSPEKSKFDFSRGNLEQLRLWCIGFAIGDGRECKGGTCIRICGDKSKFNQNFRDAGFNVTTPKCYRGDDYVYLEGIYKQEFLDNFEKYDISREDAQYLINGLLSADGNKNTGGKDGYRSICTSDSRVQKLIKMYLETTEYYISNERIDYSRTNYKEDRELTWYNINNMQSGNWKVIKIEEDIEEDVWCLEVEEDKSFVLSGGIVTGNCCLINIKDMLDNGTAINKRHIDSPHSFQVACTVMTQIIAQVASSQYGGQSVDIRHLGKYLRRSKEKYTKLLQDSFDNAKDLAVAVGKLVKKELESGVQTIQYQINTLMTTNG